MENIFRAAQEITEKISKEENQRNGAAGAANGGSSGGGGNGQMKIEDVFQSVSAHFVKMMQSGELQETFKKFQDPTVQQQQHPTEKSSIPESIQPPRVKHHTPKKQITDDLNYTMNVKLKDLYIGKKKNISYVRKSFRKTGETNQYETFEEKKKMLIQIPPGTKNGEQIIFKGESDRMLGYEAGDVIITIQEEDDDMFERDNDNLFILMDISFSEVFHLKRTFTHIDGSKYTLETAPNDVLFKHNCIRKIPGLGFPIKNTPNRGNLYIRFNVVFPEQIKPEHLKSLCDIIPPLEPFDDKEEHPPYVLEHLKQQELDTLYDENDDFNSEDSDIESASASGSDDEEEDEEEEEEEDEEEEDDDEVDEDEVEKDDKNKLKDKNKAKK